MSVRTETAETRRGPVEYVDLGAGEPVLVVHGSPGGCDQGALLGGFLPDAGFRVIAPSRPGYLGTPLTADNATAAGQADLWVALMDSLGVEHFGVLCWSGGGPSSYALTIEHPERVTALVALGGREQAVRVRDRTGVSPLDRPGREVDRRCHETRRAEAARHDDRERGG